MSKFQFFIYFLFLIIFQANIFCQDEPEKVSINFNDTLTLDSENSFNKFYVLEFSEEELEEGSIIEISTTPTNYAIPAYIYCSFENENPSADSREFTSQTLGKNIVFINSSKMKGHEKLYINIHSSKETEINIFILKKNEIYISPQSKKLIFKLSDNSKVFFSTNVSEYNDFENSKLLLYGLGENKDYFKMSIKYKEEENQITDIPCSQMFENGYGAFVDLKNMEKIDYGKFEITFEPSDDNYKEKKIEVGFDFVDNSKDNLIEVNILEHVHGGAENGETCYEIKDMIYENKIAMLINAFSQDITFTIKKYGEKLYSLDVFNNGFIKFPKNLNESVYNNSYFCLKKFTPKEKEKEELGPISYDFQIYYENELPEIQSYIMPLINGKVYTHSLNSGDIFIYRHNSFNGLDAEKIYSANLLAIRGKPKMYGYPCETYPDCNLNQTKFEELKNNGKIDIIKPFNQYFINKKKDALGNTQIDENGEPLSDLRKQYLTIIYCESPEDFPNYGECKYALEINNELDQIQLAPEIVFATSVISKDNDFLIKISDYENIEYLKITFTVLTGNAEIYLPDEQNYEFRHAHRKEVIKITDMKESYAIKIKASEPAFIELKYETDFYFRGYTMMNPNEINIEYLNKADGPMPFEIINPDYFYPINDKRNNDFYFTIKTLDCAMDYTYNFQDFPNITSIHHEVNTSDINFGTSYAFNLKISEYFHTANDQEDCAMIIYTGEKSENTPLLMISDMPHPSNFSETYYIYPFIYNSDFKGIFVDMKFDYESLSKIEKSPLVEVTFKIGEQESEFQKCNIKNDETFFINKEEAEKYCKNNLQCSLTIQIKKIFEKDESVIPYIIKTNVYSSKISPEYIYNNKIYNYKLLPNGAKYLYTQVNNNEEGEINILFNKGNPEIFAKIVGKNKKEENHNWNGRIFLPDSNDKDLLQYDPIKGVINYSTKDNQECQVGCELYIIIKGDEKNNQNEFSEITLSVNAKYKKSFIEGLTLNKYIKGNLPEKGAYKCYNIIIPEDFKRISINLYSSYGKALIKYNNIPSNDEYDWELIPTNSFGRLVIKCDDNKIKKETLKGVSLTIGVTNNDDLPEGDTNLNYYLELQGLYNNEIEYYDLTTERSIICDTQKQNYCHVLLYLNNIKNNLISALPLSSFDQINIYAKFYTSEDLGKKAYKDSIQDLFPNEDKNDQKSNSQFLLLDSTKFKKEKDNIVLLTIDCGKKNALIRIVLSEDEGTDILLPYNTDKIISLNSNEINILMENTEDIYMLLIDNLKGNSILNISDENYEINGKHYIEFKQSDDSSIKINSNEESKILLNYEKEDSNKVYELSENTEIEFPLSGEKFPQYTYYVINSIPSGKIKEISISFKDIEYKEDNKNSSDLFNIIGYILNEKEFQSIKINPKKEKKEKQISPSKKNDEYTISISNSKITNDANNYIFIEIDKNEENKNNYQKIKTSFSVKDIKDNSQDDDDDDGGHGWIVVLVIILVICVILLIALYLYKKKRLSNMKNSEEEINKITPLRQDD